MHYLHVCVFFVTEIPRREEIMTKVRKHRVCASCTSFSVLTNALCSDGDAKARSVLILHGRSSGPTAE